MISRVSLLVPALNRGGMTRAYVLAGALHHIGIETEIVGALAAEAPVYPEPPAGIPVRPVVERSLARRVVQTRRTARGELLYAIKPRATSLGIALLTGWGRPVVVDIDDSEGTFKPARSSHGVPWPRRSARRVRGLVRRIGNPDHPAFSGWMESLVPQADAVTANTRVLADRFGAVYVPSGKDTALFDPSRFDPQACRRALGLEGKRVVMFPGTVRPHKGLDDVVAALERLGWDDARLVIVGGRDIGDEHAENLARRYPNLVVRLARRATADMPAVVAAAHVVVAPQHDVPSARAQFPMKLTDAMAMAKPIVSTRVGDIPAVLDGAAYLVPPVSPAAIADAIANIFARPDEAARRGAEARRRCVERHSYEALGRVLRGVIAQATNRSTGA